MPRLFDLLADDSSRNQLSSMAARPSRSKPRRAPADTQRSDTPAANHSTMTSLPDFVAVDLETTGLDSRTDQIIEVAAVKFVDGKPGAEFSSFVNPGRPIPAAITALTGIRAADVEQAPAFSALNARLREFIADSPVCGHQVEFDVNFLDEQWKREGLERLTNQRIDTAAMARLALPDLSGYSLGAVCRHLDVTLAQAHRALDDARASGMAALAIVPHLRAIDPRIRRILATFAHRSILRSLILDNAAPRQTEPAASRALERWPRLKPDPDAVAKVDVDAVADAFSSQGLGAHVENFAPRQQQTDMALRVARTINGAGLLTVEAGTGTGKSLAYLVPLAMAALSSGKSTLVVTHTRNLQDQLAGKDLPVVQQLLGGTLKYSVLKGRANYLCRNRYDRLLAGGLVNLAPREREGLLPLIRWAETTRTGDIEEQRQFNRRWHGRVWTAICADSHGCAGQRCAYFDECYLQRARQRAAGSHVIVINQALFFSDIISQSSTWLAGSDLMVFDEAHHLEESGHRTLCTTIETNRLKVFFDHCTDLVVSLEKQARDEGAQRAATDIKKLLRTLRHRGDDLLTACHDWAASHAASGREMRVALEPRAIEQLPQSAAFGLALGEFQDALLALQRAPGAEDAGEEDTTAGDLQMCSTQTSQLKADFAYIGAAHTESHVFWVEGDREKKWVKLCGTPLDIGAVLAPVWAAERRAAIFTSATLSIAGNLEYFQKRIGLTGVNAARVDGLILSSPFSADQSFRSAVRRAPDPSSAEFPAFCAGAIATLHRRFKRNTLVLFTAHSMMRDVESELRRTLGDREFPLFSQASGQSRTQLMLQFKRSSQAILLGTSSFWEGVDAPGEECEMVVIPRLPFAVPTEPLTQALAHKAETEYGESFFSYSVPEAIIRLRQGAGRLIRSTTDRGALVILDNRLVSKGYGRAFAASLDGPLQVFDGVEELSAALGSFFEHQPHDRLRYVPQEDDSEINDWTT